MVTIKRLKATLPSVFIVVNFQLQERSCTLKSSKTKSHYITLNIKFGKTYSKYCTEIFSFYGFYDYDEIYQSNSHIKTGLCFFYEEQVKYC